MTGSRIFRAGVRSWRQVLAGGVSTLTLALASTPAWAARDYWRTTLERITVVSSGSARVCDRLALRFIAFERALLHVMGESPDAELLPVAIYQLADRDAVRVMFSPAEAAQMVGTNQLTYSKFLPGADFHMAVMIEGQFGDRPLQSALMFYAQTLMLSGSMARRPPWYQLGISHLLNGAMIRDDGSLLLNRNLQFRPVGPAGRASPQYDLATVLRMGPREANTADTGAFIEVAREFAKFGLLTTEARRAAYRELSVQMEQGAPAEDAVLDTFGVDLAALVAEFEGGEWKRGAQYRVAPAGTLPPAPACARLDDETVETLLGVVASRAALERPAGM